ncbi:hypothetical protein L596_001748 [Steinernema carpocapsae]|uniref:Uncharacterized protein n=1 Tax=Steinernema carpocapsae TaxID=34508 RepID=A0A4U8UMF2_STECR|nr:hypothetical protein L596_001748 [Steinernema carpocapsae]
MVETIVTTEDKFQNGAPLPEKHVLNLAPLTKNAQRTELDNGAWSIGQSLEVRGVVLWVHALRDKEAPPLRIADHFAPILHDEFAAQLVDNADFWNSRIANMTNRTQATFNGLILSKCSLGVLHLTGNVTVMVKRKDKLALLVGHSPDGEGRRVACDPAVVFLIATCMSLE